jgi:hypothetical protein
MKWLEENFPEKHAWLIEEEMGIPRAQMLSTDTLDDRLVLEESLKEIKRRLSD